MSWVIISVVSNPLTSPSTAIPAMRVPLACVLVPAAHPPVAAA